MHDVHLVAVPQRVGNICPEMFRDYQPALLADCCREVVAVTRAFTIHQATLALVGARLGWVSDSEALRRAVAV